MRRKNGSGKRSAGVRRRSGVDVAEEVGNAFALRASEGNGEVRVPVVAKKAPGLAGRRAVEAFPHGLGMRPARRELREKPAQAVAEAAMVGDDARDEGHGCRGVGVTFLAELVVLVARDAARDEARRGEAEAERGQLWRAVAIDDNMHLLRRSERRTGSGDHAAVHGDGAIAEPEENAIREDGGAGALNAQARRANSHPRHGREGGNGGVELGVDALGTDSAEAEPTAGRVMPKRVDGAATRAPSTERGEDTRSAQLRKAEVVAKGGPQGVARNAQGLKTQGCPDVHKAESPRVCGELLNPHDGGVRRRGGCEESVEGGLRGQRNGVAR